MNVFLTGGSGHIGAATIRALVTAGHTVAALARSDASASHVGAAGAQPVAGGLQDLEVLRAAAAGADGVIHLAQASGPDTASIDAAASRALQDGVGAGPYVHTGGLWVYGDTHGIVDETAPFGAPPIVAWRIANERLVMERVRTGGRPVLVMPALVYGNGRGLLYDLLVRPARSLGAVPYIDEGHNHVALVHVDDIADLYVKALAAHAGSVYAGANGQYIEAHDLAAALSQGAGLGGATRSVTREELRDALGPFGPAADALALDQMITSDRAHAELGWDPRHVDALGEIAREN
jgi:nucleoside-diphosphate-sugar epimerase